MRSMPVGKKCMIIGFNEFSFADYTKMINRLDERSAAYRDLRLAYVEHEGQTLHALGLLNHMRGQLDLESLELSNADFLWPVVMVLGSYLHQHNIAFDYINLFQREKEYLRIKLKSGEFSTVAITTTLYVMPHPIQEIVSFVREHAPNVKIIIGGPYISGIFKSYQKEDLGYFLTTLGGDIYINSNEGEDTLREVQYALAEGKSVAGLHRTATMQGEEWIYGPDEPEYNDLADNPIDYNLFRDRGIGGFISTRTAKSCPYACAFCGFPQRAGKYKFVGVQDVEQVLDSIKDLQTVHTLTFLDDTFNVPKTRFKDILKLMIRKKYGFKWNSFYRSDQGDEETIQLMAEAGCEGVFLGIESASDKMLERMRKTSRRVHYERALDAFNREGISAHTSFIVGFPGENAETIQESIDFIEQYRPETFRAQVWYCDPLTPIWEERERYGVTGSGFDWRHDTMSSVTAAAVVERFFLSVTNSTWLPQFGFENWSLFYLNRIGMGWAAIFKYLESFNLGVRHNLIGERGSPLPDHLLQEYRTLAALPSFPSCRKSKPSNYGAASKFKAAEHLLRTLPPAWFPATNFSASDKGHQKFTMHLDGDRAAFEAKFTDAARIIIQLKAHLGEARPFWIQIASKQGAVAISCDKYSANDPQQFGAQILKSASQDMSAEISYLLSSEDRLAASNIAIDKPLVRIMLDGGEINGVTEDEPNVLITFPKVGDERSSIVIHTNITGFNPEGFC